MKLSISLSESEVEALDDYVSAHALPSRSAGVQAAIRQLRLPSEYEAAWSEWQESDDDSIWDHAIGDGIS